MGRPLFGSEHTANCICPKCTAVTASPQPNLASVQHRTHSNIPWLRPSSSTTTEVPHNIPESLLQTISESQASLSRASFVIEATYERLVALRIRLRQNTETMSMLSHLVPNSRMGPEHSAIVLSDDSQPAPVSEDTSGSAPVVDMVVDEVNQEPHETTSATSTSWNTVEASVRMTDDTIRRRFHEIAGSDRSTTAQPDLNSHADQVNPSWIPRPSSSSSSLFPTVRPSSLRTTDGDTLYFNVYSRRAGAGANSSESTTTLGRRVEARAAASRSAARSAEDTANRILELRTSIDSYISRLNRHGEELLAAASSLRQEPRQSSARSTPRASQATPTPAAPTSSSEPTVSGTNRRLVTAAQLQEEFDRVTTRTRDDLHDSEQRWRNWGNRPVDTHTRFPLIDWEAMPTAADEFGTYLASLRDSYRDRRRRPGEGDGEALPPPPPPPPPFTWPMDLSTDSEDDEELDWLLNTTERRRRSVRPPAVGLDSERTRTDMLGRARAALLTSPPTSQERTRSFQPSAAPLTATSAIVDTSRTRRRRRGWARLDRDGNEIPTDEEEEYERNRAHMRARAQALSGGNTAGATSTESLSLPPPPPTHQRPSYMLNATTRNEMTAPQEPAAIRVRLSSRHRDGPESQAPREQRTRLWNRQPAQSAHRQHTETLVVPARVPSPSPSPSPAPVSFQASPLPWATVELVPTVARIKERRASRVRASMRPPAAGR